MSSFFTLEMSMVDMKREEKMNAANFLSIPKSDDQEIQGFYDRLIGLGFKIEHTGGGCTLWAKYFLDGTYIWVSQELEAKIDRDLLDKIWVTVGLYHGEECEGEYFDSPEISQAVAFVNMLVRLKESKLFDVVSTTQYQITLKEE